MIQIPGQSGWRQSNQSDRLGTIKESFNVDLESNIRNVRTTRSKLIASGGNTQDEIGRIAGITTFDAIISVFTGQAGGDHWKGGNSPFDGLTLNNGQITPAMNGTDTANFQGKLYVTTDSDIEFSSDGTSFTAKSASLTSGTPHLLASKGDFLYLTDDRYKIYNVDTLNVVNKTGTATLDLDLGTTYFQTVLMTSSDRVWVGLSSTASTGYSNALIYEWNGITENAISRRYEINAPAIMCGVMKDDVPYVLDCLGRLLRWNGGVFAEVDRLPMNKKMFKDFSSINLANRVMHPRCIDVDGDEILINVSNAIDNDTETTFADFPAGVWAWSERTGFYHKFSPSYQAVADTGTTNLTDYGQARIYFADVLKVIESFQTTTGDGGRVVWGASYFTDADDATSDLTYGVFTNDTADNTQKAGYIITPKIHSSTFRDKWQKIYAAFSELDGNDKCVLKYRTDDTELYTNIEWRGTDAFEPTEVVSDFEQGDEVQIVQGTGSGTAVEIDRVTTGSGEYIALKESVTGASGTSVAKLAKWRKVGEITDQSIKGYPIGEESHWIQFKIYMNWTGAKELYDLLVENSTSIK